MKYEELVQFFDESKLELFTIQLYNFLSTTFTTSEDKLKILNELTKDISSELVVECIVKMCKEPYLLIDEYDMFRLVVSFVSDEKIFFCYLNYLFKLGDTNTSSFEDIYLYILKKESLTKEQKTNYILKCINCKITLSIEIIIWLVNDKFFTVINYIIKNKLLTNENIELILCLLIQDETISYNDSSDIIKSFKTIENIPRVIKKYSYSMRNKYNTIFSRLLYEFIVENEKFDFFSIFLNYFGSISATFNYYFYNIIRKIF
jgi:hypothetical protein